MNPNRMNSPGPNELGGLKQIRYDVMPYDAFTSDYEGAAPQVEYVKRMSAWADEMAKNGQEVIVEIGLSFASGLDMAVYDNTDGDAEEHLKEIYSRLHLNADGTEQQPYQYGNGRVVIDDIGGTFVHALEEDYWKTATEQMEATAQEQEALAVDLTLGNGLGFGVNADGVYEQYVAKRTAAGTEFNPDYLSCIARPDGTGDVYVSFAKAVDFAYETFGYRTSMKSALRGMANTFPQCMAHNQAGASVGIKLQEFERIIALMNNPKNPVHHHSTEKGSEQFAVFAEAVLTPSAEN